MTPVTRKFFFVLVVLVAVAIELLAFAGVTLVSRRVRPRLVWTPDVPQFEAGYERFRSTRHPVLGWPGEGDERFDVSGSRPVPAFPNTAESCVALFGDSFTFGSEVSDDAAWGNLLARRLGCRVANYGVGGYGTDQAFLRFLDRERDRARIVILGIFEDNLQRNVNRYRALLVGESTFSFKPRFKLNDRGELELVPIRLPDADEAHDFLKDPGRILDHEHFLPGSRAGPVRPTFPFTLTASRLFFHPDIQAVLRRRPYWERFYQPGHASRALEITVEIVEAFQAEVASREKQLLVVVIPSPKTMQRIGSTGHRSYQNLIDSVIELGIPVEDLSHGMLSRLSGRSPCEIATRPDVCRGHFNEEGNVWVADIVHEALAREGWLPAGTLR